MPPHSPRAAVLAASLAVVAASSLHLLPTSAPRARDSSAAAAPLLRGGAAAAAPPNYTILQNTRCYNDVGQFHNITSYEECEPICLGNQSAPLFTYCPNSNAVGCGVNGGPQPLTCWCFQLSSLSGCNTQEGWISGYFAPPPIPPPADWQPLIDAGQMAYTSDPPAAIGEGYFPVVANGFVGFETGPYTQDFVNAWPWRDAGSLKMAGVYSGYNWTTPSHRAQIPKVSAFTLLEENGVTYKVGGAAIDWSAGLSYNRTVIVSGSSSCPDGTVIEERAYAHRGFRELFVYEVRAFPEGSPSLPVASTCTVSVSWPITPDWLGDTKLTQSLPPSSSGSSDSSSSSPAIWQGTTALPEEVGLPLRMIAVAFDAWVAGSAGNGVSSLTFTPTQSTVSVRAVLRSDLDVTDASTPADVANAAASTWATYTAMSSDDLLHTHVVAMQDLWSSGVELAGNASFAATVNASLYDIVSSFRADWNWSSSPGGLATGGYCGHSFWDFETWMSPVLTVLFPSLIVPAIQYRLDRLQASVANAQSQGYDGAMWAWESAFTGLFTAPWRQADTNENHISADIPLSWRKHWYASGDKDLLAAMWPALNETCRFWECRFTRTDSKGNGPPNGYAPNCAAKDGSGNWTVKNVISPDESSGVINDSVYTNAAGSQTLAWCLEAASVLGIPSSSLPPLWPQIAAAPFLPLNGTLYSGGPVHMQNSVYNGHTINQADVALMQYPLGLDFGEEQNQRDLDYYTSVTDFAGMFTGDGAYACAYLALGNRSAADAQLQYAFNHIEPHFNVFHETAFDDGHTQHFITGSGGYIQSFLFGYASCRIPRLGVLSFSSQQPILPPYNVSAVKLRGVHLLGTAFDFSYDAQNLCVVLQQGQGSGAAPLELRVLANGQKLPLSSSAPVCVPVQAVEVAGVGYQ